MNVQILQHLSKPETRCIIYHLPAHTIIINIDQTRISTIFNSAIRLQTIDCLFSSFQILRVPSHTPSIEIGFEDFRSKDIIRSGDVETMFIVEIVLSFCCWVTTGVIAIGRNKGKYFRSNPGPEEVIKKIGERKELFNFFLSTNRTLTQLKHRYSNRSLRVEARFSQFCRRRVICHLVDSFIRSLFPSRKKAVETYQVTSCHHRSKQDVNQGVESSYHCRSQLDRHDLQLLKSNHHHE